MYNLSNRDPSLDSPSLDPSFQFSRSIKQSRIPRSSLRNIIFFGKNKITTIEQIVRALDSNSVVYLLIALVVRLIAIISRLIKLLRKFSSIKTFITTISINLNPFQIRREGKEKKKQNGCLSVSSSFVSLPLFRRFLFYRACGSRPWKLTRRPIYADLHFPPPPLVRLMRASPPPPRDEPRINIVNLVDATCEQRRLINHRIVINRQSQRLERVCYFIFFFLCSLSLSLSRNIFIFVEELNKRMCIYSYIGKREQIRQVEYSFEGGD